MNLLLYTFLTIYWKSINLLGKAAYGLGFFLALLHFVKEREKWTLLHKNQFLEDGDTSSNKKIR